MIASGQGPSELAETRDALRQQGRIISALLLRETRTRFSSSRLGYLWAVAEPIMHVLVLSTIWLVVLRRPPVGTSLMLFFVTGIVPYLLFIKTSQRVMGAITANRAMLQLPVVKNVDVITARAVLELATMVIILAVLLAVMAAIGLMENTSVEPLTLAAALLTVWGIGVGVGTIGAVLSPIFKSWDRIYSIATRPLYLISGIFFMVERFPPPWSGYLLYNPIMHCIEWVRSAFYPGYGRYTISEAYAIGFAVTTILIGLAMERVLRDRLTVSRRN